MRNFILVLLALVVYSFGAGGAAITSSLVDGAWAGDVAKTYSVSSSDSLDTLDGADSIALDYTSFGKPYQYVIGAGPLSGDSAANAVVQVVLKAYDVHDSLFSSTVVDTIPAAGVGSILLPIRTTVIGTKYKVYIKSLNANDEVKIPSLSIFRRWPEKWYNRNGFH